MFRQIVNSCVRIEIIKRPVNRCGHASNAAAYKSFQRIADRTDGHVGIALGQFFATSIVLAEQMSGTGESIGILLKTYAVAILFWLAYQLTQGLPVTLLTPENFPKVLCVGISGNLMPYLLFLWSIQRVHAERAGIVATLEPFVAAILAWMWFGQTLSVLQIIGGVLIIVAVTALQVKKSPSQSSGH